MEIKIEIKKTYDDPTSPVMAKASIVLDDCFAIKEAKLIDKKNGKGIFVAMPGYKSRDGRWRDFCHPLTSEFRKEIELAYIDAYNERIAEELAAETDSLDESDESDEPDE
jgi:stage V sporulation protein G